MPGAFRLRFLTACILSFLLFSSARMTEEIDRGECKPAWASFWALIAMQVQNSFTVSIIKFLLIPLGAWLTLQQQGGFMAKHTEHVVSLLLVLPYLLFSPAAGWIGDRFPKSRVIKTAAIAQWGIVMLLIVAIWLRSLNLGFICFFLYSLQCCLLSPSKLGVVKELVGSRRLAFATGVVEGTVILAILAGQIAGGIWFDGNLHDSHDGWNAALEALFWIAAIAFGGALTAQLIHKTRAQGIEPFRKELLVSHIRDSKVVWSDKELRISAVGTAFFWAFAGFVNLVVIEIAKQTSREDLGTAISKLMFFASLGIALGSIFAGLLSKRGIEWSLAPIGLFLMSIGLFVLSTLDTHSAVLPYFLSFAGAGAAMFLVPVNTFVQDHPPAEKRGTVIAVSNFFNNLGGISAVIIQLVMVLVGMHVQMQFLLLAILTLGIAILAAKKWMPELLRVIILPIVRLIYRLRVIGRQHIPEKGGVLLVPNHVTWADAFFVSAACHRPVRFVMFDGFMSAKGIGWFARLFDTVPISSNRAKDAIRVVSEALQAGDVVCLYAEGELSRTGCLQEIKRGFELMARKANAPVIPMWMDGAWGSVFSFERGRFFKKVPYSLPYPLTIVFEAALPAEVATADLLRHALMRASAEALEERAKRLGLLRRDNPAVWINGLQMGQVNALQRKQEIVVWEKDLLAKSLTSIHQGFAALFGSRVLSQENDVIHQSIRVGGAATRELLEKAGEKAQAGVFYDFAYAPASLPAGILHCRCYAHEGIVIAMSMPDPPLAMPTSNVQLGSCDGSVGLLLPGFSISSENDVLTVHGPALPATGVRLPAGSSLDERGFLSLGSNPS
jgi:acyl-[acyl-carrier-protein]-phospholipid O-acyltransferase / long-chain-fatty-acid--[acyl-carrier-protein] ligase